ncbi:MAG TPA: carboxypeptidase regulatory-like domain-containing protein [Gemmatimonadaceae bacterium]|nr:carboxypeptidase regulatory-like domain-containing protein [Gemmatimonadaceae bacterium]
MASPTFPRARAFALTCASLVLVALSGTPVLAQQATTTGAVRGIVTGPDGAPIHGVTVVTTNDETGVKHGAQTDESGRYQIPFLPPGPYTVRAQFIGYRAVEKAGYRIGLGQVERVDFQLEQVATQLAAQRVVADATPLIETQKAGTSTRIDQRQIAELPTNGRNFKDLVVLAPGTSDVSGGGAGGGQAIGGGRTASSNLLMDGVNNNESFFGGDARGGDRAPFSYSIEAVKEIQVITAGYDVERGNFTGGTVNAVTKSGTNRFQGSVFGFLRDNEAAGVKLTARDFNGALPTDFRKQQYGLSLGGPIVKDHAHFFFTFDKQNARDPRPVFTGAALDPASRGFRFHADTLARILQVAKDSLGYDLSSEVGNFVQNVDETALFGRVDWQLNDKHTLTLRDNYVKFAQLNDRLITQASNPGDFLSNAGPYETRSNSVVASLTSVFTGALTNELRAQTSYEHKPRPSNPAGQFGVPVPQVSIRGITSLRADGTPFTTGVNFGADPVLHVNNLEEQTTELIDNLRYTRGSHTFKLGTDLQRVHVFNDFFFNGLGTFSYSSLAAFEANTPTGFTRSLPLPGKSRPIADYSVLEGAVYAQDEWQVTPQLFLSYGLRYDRATYPDRAEENAAVADSFPGLHTSARPEDNNNVSPRIGFTFDPAADGRQVLRGGTGLFYGRSPYVLYANVLTNTGRTQLSLSCAAGNVPRPDFASYASDPSTVPTTCANGAGAGAGAANPVVFSPDFQQSSAWKSNLAYDRVVAGSWRVGVEGVYTKVRDNYLVSDANLNTTPRFYADGKIPVLVDPTKVNPATGAVRTGDSRLKGGFGNVFVQNDLGETNSFQGILSATGRLARATVTASYTYDNTRDNGSTSCCIAGSDIFSSTRAAGNPNDFGGQWGPASFSRTHTFVFSPSVELPYGFTVSGIFRAFSGIPWTARYLNDVNGDGATDLLGVGNDRIYVPTKAEVQQMDFFVDARSTVPAADQIAAQRALLEQKIGGRACLSDARGRFVGRNSCRNPMQNVLDARVSKKFNTIRGQNLELVADFFNVLNGLNKDWGKRLEVSSTDQALLSTTKFDPTTQKFTYRVNNTFGRATPSQFTLTQQFQMQLGLRYTF